MLSPPVPPAGSVLDHVAECVDKAYVCYGKYNGDGNSKQFLGQTMENTNSPVTGFGLIIGRHGMPVDPLIIGLNMGGPPADPMSPDGWTNGYGVINAADIPTADEFYWLTAVLDTPIPTPTAHLFLAAVTNADYTADSYWSWAACEGIPSGFNQGEAWTIADGWYAIPDTLSYLTWTQGTGTVTCWRCNGTTPESQTFPSGTVCGQGVAVGYPYTSQPTCTGVQCCKCVGTTLQCQNFPSGTTCGQGDAAGWPYAPGHSCGGGGCTNPTGIEGDTDCRGEDEYTCTGGQWVLTDANSPNCQTCKCSTYTQESVCTNAKDTMGRTCCWWYSKYLWEEPKCTDREPTIENRIMDYLPFIIAGVGGIAVIALLLRRRTPQYYPPQQPYPPQGGR